MKLKLSFRNLSAFCSVLLISSSFAQNLKLEKNWWHVNGEVYTIAKDTLHDRMFLGGDFTTLSPTVFYGSEVDSGTGFPSLNYPRPNAHVLAAVSDGNGGWYIGGAFTKVGDSLRSKLAHITASGLVSSFNPSPNDYVSTLFLKDSLLVIGGGFSEVKAIVQDRFSVINIHTGSPVNWNPNISGSVSTVAVKDTIIYLGGNFASINGQTRRNAAALGLNTGQLLPWNPDVNSTVSSIIVHEDKVYMGGSFSTVGTIMRNRIASVDALTGAVSSWDPSPNGTIYSLAADANKIYAGGNFSYIGGKSTSHLATLDTGTGAAFSWFPNVNNAVYAISTGISKIYIGGDFNSISGQRRERFAILDSATGSLLSEETFANDRVQTIAFDGTNLYVGGNFLSLGMIKRNYIAAMENSTGKLLSWTPEANNIVRALAVRDTIVYVGGNFTGIGGQTRNYIAAVGVESGQALNWNPNASSIVYCLYAGNSSIYAGGSFSTIGDSTRARVAELNYSTGSSTGWTAGSLSGTVYSIILHNKGLFIGGAFYSIGGVSRANIALLDTVTGAVDNLSPNANSTVYAMAIDGNVMYVGGNFTNIGGQTRNRIAAINIQTGGANSWNPNVSGSGASVRAVGYNDSLIYIGGKFAAVGSGFNDNFEIVRKSTGVPIGSSFDMSYEVYAVVQYKDTLYIGGAFERITQVFRSGLAVYTYCVEPEMPIIVGDDILCRGEYTNLQIIGGKLNDAEMWEWSASCSIFGTKYGVGDSLGALVLSTRTYKVRGIGGCSISPPCSTITVTVIQPASYPSKLKAITCDKDLPYIWNNKNYTMSGVYYDTLDNRWGCDSVVELTLTVNRSDSSVLHVRSCDSFVFNGKTLTSSDIYYDTLINKSGCDSVVKLYLTLVTGNYTNFAARACDSYIFHTKTLTASGTYYDTLVNLAGCDSVIRLDLTIDKSSGYSFSATSCFNYNFRGNVLSKSGTYKETLTNAVGCDSIVTLTLTINSVKTVVTKDGYKLISDEPGASYQWLDCAADYAVIPNATSRDFTPSENGNYAVEIKKNNCIDTSGCVVVTGVSIAGVHEIPDLKIYPNPFDEKFSINIENESNGQYELKDVNGKLLLSGNLGSDGGEINSSGLAPGVYFLTLKFSSNQYSYKLIKVNSSQ